MADISKINLPNSSVYDLKDSAARADIGTLSSLTTTAKTNLVAAINEINGTIGDINTMLEEVL